MDDAAATETSQTFTVEIFTPYFVRPPREVCLLDVPAAEGRLTVLHGHQPFICELRAGEVRVADAEGSQETWSIGGGTMWVTPGGVTILTRDVTTAPSTS